MFIKDLSESLNINLLISCFQKAGCFRGKTYHLGGGGGVRKAIVVFELLNEFKTIQGV